MKLIVGLGNPGQGYAKTRHNIGFMLVKKLAKDYRISLKRHFGISALAGKGKIGRYDVILAMPLTFMNLSGNAVADLVKKYRVDLDSLLIVYDDLDLDFGRIKIRHQGSCGGHNGVMSIIDKLKTEEFCRLRLGSGRPAKKGADLSEFVLSEFTKKEEPSLKVIIEAAGECCKSWVIEGINKSMNLYNKDKERN